MKKILLAVWLVSACGSLAAQQPAFEVADVHPSPRTQFQAPSGRGGVPRDGLYRVWQASLVDLIRFAYGVDADKVTGGPHYIEMDRFDIVAKVPANATRESVKPMLQALLKERFGLVVREEAKSFPVYALVAGPGEPKLKESPASVGTCRSDFQAPGSPGGLPSQLLTCSATSMATLAQRLVSAIGGAQVVDATGRPGLWDFQVALPMTSSTQPPDVKAVTDNLSKYVGLALEQRTVSLPTITVVQATRMPTPNPPAVATAFPSGPEPEFEVAEIKPAAGGQAMERILPTGQLTGQNIPLREMIGLAWQIQPASSIVGPKAIDAPLWDVIAKISSRPLDPMDTDIDAVTTMMRRLLQDRFHLKAHVEDRPGEAYTLVASGQHRLTKADPAGRTKCVRTGASGQGFPAMRLTCQNMTVGELAERLQQLEPQEFAAPVLDQTGIEGRWDITVVYTPAALLRAYMEGFNSARAAGAAPGGLAPSAPGASDPTGAMTMAQAFERTLGIKLEMRRRPVPVLVVDSVDAKPTDN